MSSSQGKFVWYELMSKDVTVAAAFYKAAIGWLARDAGMPGMPYTLVSAAETPIGGLMAMPAEAREAGARPGWMGYIGVDDVDAYVARIKQVGGAVQRAAVDIPGVGRFAVVADPQGASFVLFRPISEQPAARPAPGTSGYVGWHELHTSDPQAALAFYAGQFGWTKAEALEMGPMGIYQLFAIDAAPVGGMMKLAGAARVPFWLYYFNTEAVDAAVLRVKANGGELINGPQQVPGGSWIAQCLDPEGAMFALIGSKR